MAAIGLALLGSFAYVLVASIGTFFIAAALIARAVVSRASRGPALLALLALALIVFGMTAAPLFFAGWGLFGVAVLLALMAARRGRTASP